MTTAIIKHRVPLIPRIAKRLTEYTNFFTRHYLQRHNIVEIRDQVLVFCYQNARPDPLCALCVAVRKGTDVDQPRNLAKSVTVK